MVTTARAGIESATDAALAARIRGAALVLGLEAWAVLLVFPSLEHGVRGSVDVIVALAPLGALALGAWRASSGRRDEARRAWLAAVPATLAVATALRDDLARRDAWGGATGGFAAVSVAAFVAVAARAVEVPIPSRASASIPAPRRPEPFRLTWRDVVRTLALGGAWLGAAALVTVAPLGAGRADAEVRFGEAADEARVLAVAAGAALACVALAGILGPGLRARKRSDEAPDRVARTVRVSLALSIAAALGWLALRGTFAG